MTIEQITAINNGMSMLSTIYECAFNTWAIKEFTDYIDSHIKALKDADVDNHIVEHFESLCYACLPIAEESVKEHEYYEAPFEEAEDMEDQEANYHSYTPEADLAALRELKAKLEANNSSL